MGTGKKLKELLKKRNMTVAELSRSTGISAQTLYSIINRDSSISYDNLLLLSSVLKIEINELIETKTIYVSIPDAAIKDMAEKMAKDMENSDTLELLYIYDQLNDIGKKEALKRVEELTEIPKYRKEEN